MELGLSNGQFVLAQNTNNSINVMNTVEDNYKNYYNIYSKYKQENFSAPDSAMLANIAALCAGMDGAIVYQARALYNLMYKTIKNYKENCDATIASVSRVIAPTGVDPLNTKTQNNWNVDIFPNPTTGGFNIVSKEESEELQIIITDIAGKLIYKNTLTTVNFIANLELRNKPGVYLISITNSTYESSTKKLVITD